MPGIIRTYNEAVGTANTDTAGYHETLTQLYIRGVRAFLATCVEDGLLGKVNALLRTTAGWQSASEPRMDKLVEAP